MRPDLSSFAARLRERILAQEVQAQIPWAERGQSLGQPGCSLSSESVFNELALRLFALQFTENTAYRRTCQAQDVAPNRLDHWRQIPAVPTAAFKEIEFSCLPVEERIGVFHSSGTTDQRPSRHFHSAQSLALYETLLWPWFAAHVLADFKAQSSKLKLVALTPSLAHAPRSSLVHMFDIVRRQMDAPPSSFMGILAEDSAWTLDFERTSTALRTATETGQPILLLGTAFSFVHLVDFLVENNRHLLLPPGSRLMETGGYKGRARVLPKSELHALLNERLGIPLPHIVCEYGMSELSSQAYDIAVPCSRAGMQDRTCSTDGEKRRLNRALRSVAQDSSPSVQGVQAVLDTDPTAEQRSGAGLGSPALHRVFHFPPWTRVRIVSPDTGNDVAEGETGLLRVFDLANAFSVMAIQTEDLAIRRGDGIELAGRAPASEIRGCSLMQTAISSL